MSFPMGNLRDIDTDRIAGGTRGETIPRRARRLTVPPHALPWLFAIRSPVLIYETLLHLAGFSRFELLDFSLKSVELVPI